LIATFYCWTYAGDQVPESRRRGWLLPGPTKELTVAIGLVEPPIVLLAAGAAAAPRVKAVGQPMASTTHLRCGGCHADARYTQNEAGYGRLVRAFLGRHEPCGDAVKITCVRGGHS
jgi:hypothetical protein